MIRCARCDGWRGNPCGEFCRAVGGERTEAYPSGLAPPRPPAKPTGDGMTRAEHVACYRLVHVLNWGHVRTEAVIASGPAALAYPWRPSAGLRLCWCPPHVARRRMSDEARYRGRRNRLRKRLQRKRPMFADAEYEAEIRARPEYYGLTRSVPS